MYTTLHTLHVYNERFIMYVIHVCIRVRQLLMYVLIITITSLACVLCIADDVHHLND